MHNHVIVKNAMTPGEMSSIGSRCTNQNYVLLTPDRLNVIFRMGLRHCSLHAKMGIDLLTTGAPDNGRRISRGTGDKT